MDTMMRTKTLAALLLFSMFSAGSAGADIELEVQQTRLRQVVERAQEAYVFIGGGSGAIISSDGFVISNDHVARHSKQWRIKTANGKTYRADLVGLAPNSDLALLKIRDAANLPFLPIGDSDRLAVGEQVVAIGNPFALGNTDNIPTVTLGVVSAAGINGPNVGEVVLTDASTNPGNSGGPLINLAGELIGVNYAQMPSRFGIRINTGHGYAISSNQLKRFLDALKSAKGGKVEIGAINGVKFDYGIAATQPGGGTRAIIRSVEPKSPAGVAGLLAGDQIIAIGPWPVMSVEELYSLTSRYPAGGAATVAVQRGRNRMEIGVELAAVERVGLGVVFEQASNNSLKIERVVPNSPAHVAGIRPGDVIRSIGAVGVPTRQMLIQTLGQGRPGQPARVVVSRAGRQMVFNVELAGESELARLVQAAVELPEVEPPSPLASQPSTRQE